MTKYSTGSATTAAAAAAAATSPRQVTTPTPTKSGTPTTTTRRPHFGSIATDFLHADALGATTGANAATPAALVPQNEFGGVLVTPEQIHAAFAFLDLDKKGRITPENLRHRLSIFYDQLGMKDIKLLLNDQHELTEDYLTTLLLTNEVKNFDPVAEAFKAYDPDETGFITREMLRFVFERMGYGALTEEDVNILITCADSDGDGQISLADFRKLLQ